jgi:hypothetical protein
MPFMIHLISAIVGGRVLRASYNDSWNDSSTIIGLDPSDSGIKSNIFQIRGEELNCFCICTSCLNSGQPCDESSCRLASLITNELVSSSAPTALHTFDGPLDVRKSRRYFLHESP